MGLNALSLDWLTAGDPRNEKKLEVCEVSHQPHVTKTNQDKMKETHAWIKFEGQRKENRLDGKEEENNGRGND